LLTEFGEKWPIGKEGETTGKNKANPLSRRLRIPKKSPSSAADTRDKRAKSRLCYHRRRKKERGVSNSGSAEPESEARRPFFNLVVK